MDVNINLNEVQSNSDGGRSILDQIINNQTATEVANLNVVKIINDIFAELNSREKDVLARRFGLHGQGKETLENIGTVHNLTRERIRQIETVAIKKLLQLKNLDNYLSGFKKVIYQLLEEHGGFMEKEYLIKNLIKYSLSSGKITGNGDEDYHKNYLDFLISKLLPAEFAEISNSKVLKNVFKLKYQEIDHIEELCEELFEKIAQLEKVMTTEEILNLITDELVSYNTHKEKLNISDSNIIDLSEVLRNELFDENFDVINSNKTLYSILQAAKKIEQNKFGYWGSADWREIYPKTINDKVYLILKNSREPMHFAEIADKINQIGFDDKKANAATVHNELILDKKYILIGRGLYALSEWGFSNGTVGDVIINILDTENDGLDRDEIIKRVLEQRKVKRATIVLALMDKKKFEKVDGKYKLKKNGRYNCE